jgi:Uma2 family endonuclease
VDLLADLAKALLREEKEWEAFTPITLKRLKRQGVEPDYCFYIQGREQIFGKERIDLEVDPAPDLVIGHWFHWMRRHQVSDIAILQ